MPYIQVVTSTLHRSLWSIFIELDLVTKVMAVNILLTGGKVNLMWWQISQHLAVSSPQSSHEFTLIQRYLHLTPSQYTCACIRLPLSSVMVVSTPSSVDALIHLVLLLWYASWVQEKVTYITTLVHAISMPSTALKLCLKQSFHLKILILVWSM